MVVGLSSAPSQTRKQQAANKKATNGPSISRAGVDPASTVVEQKPKSEEAQKQSGKPDKAAYEAEQEAMKKQIEVLQARQNEIRTRISTSAPKTSPEHERKLTVRKGLDALRAEQATKKGGRGKTLDQLKALQDGMAKKIKDLQTAKKKVPYNTVQEVENQIKSLERQVESGSLRLVDEKKTLTEISSLRKSRKTVETFAVQQEVIDADKAKIAEVRKELNDPEVKALGDKFDKLRKELNEINKKMDEGSKVRDGLFEERNDVSKQLDDLFAKRKATAIAFREANNAHYQKIKDERAKRDERFREERRAAEQAKKDKINSRLLEEASAPAFEREIEDCRTLIAFFQQRIGLVAPTSAGASTLFPRAQVAGVPKLEIRKIDEDLPKGVELKKKGQAEEEDSWGGLAAKKGKKGGKKSPAPPASLNGEAAEAPAAASNSNEKLNLPFTTLSALLTLGIAAPLTAGDVQKTLSDLEAKKKYWDDNQDRVTKERIAAVEAKIAGLSLKSSSPSSDATPTVPEIEASAATNSTELEEAVKDAQPMPDEEGGSKKEAVKNANGVTNGEKEDGEVEEGEIVEKRARKGKAEKVVAGPKPVDAKPQDPSKMTYGQALAKAKPLEPEPEAEAAPAEEEAEEKVEESTDSQDEEKTEEAVEAEGDSKEEA
ncbi:hypothetical protein JCM11641_002067 [Rhodosporidiobolus odoratus]